MDETSLAFDPPIARAVATGGAEMLDRISVRDYVRDVEIGAFQIEKGVTQRIRFNVVIEVSAHVAARDDDVDKVISYDTIIEAIDWRLQAERINLLETLAERLAESCLKDPRAMRVFIRIEKLDRIPGTLGVEIVRSRVAVDAPGTVSVPTTDNNVSRPELFYMSNAVIEGSDLHKWIDVLTARKAPSVICVPTMPGYMSAEQNAGSAQIGLLSIEQNCWRLHGLEARARVIDSRTELDWALKQGQLVVLAPTRIVAGALSAPDAGADDPVALAIWIADLLSATRLICIGAEKSELTDGVNAVMLGKDAYQELSEL